MGKQEYLSAGRFAALVGTTKETLFHYDEIGLFVPKRRGTNGYRYYACLLYTSPSPRDCS